MRLRWFNYSGFAAIAERADGRVAKSVCKNTGVVFPVFATADAVELVAAVQQATAAGLKCTIRRANVRIEVETD